MAAGAAAVVDADADAAAAAAAANVGAVVCSSRLRSILAEGSSKARTGVQDQKLRGQPGSLFSSSKTYIRGLLDPGKIHIKVVVGPAMVSIRSIFLNHPRFTLEVLSGQQSPH